MICEFEPCTNEVGTGVKGQQKRFCSRRCSNLHMWGAKSFEGKEIVQTCQNCGKAWTTTRSESYRRGYLTCSDECRNLSIGKKHKGRIFSDETLAKMSASQRKKILTEDHRRKIGLSISGPNNRFWKDGRSYEEDKYGGLFTEYLKETIRKRDNYTCQECGLSDNDILFHVHHIDGIKTNNTESNLILLCASCHSKVHHTTDFEPRNRLIVSLVNQSSKLL
jgi:hypothetical protein